MSERLFLRLDGDPVYAPETNVPPGTMCEFAVPAALRAHVGSLMAYQEAIPAGHEVMERVLPDGAVHLVFNVGDAPSNRQGPGLSAEVAGPSTTPALLRLRGHIEGVSITLRPGAAAALLGVPVAETAQRAVSLHELWGREADRLMERIAAAGDAAGRVDCIVHALAQRLAADSEAVRRQAAHACGLIASSGGRRPLREVAEAIGVGERRLQQIFHEHIGLTPRAWARLARLHACLRALREGPVPPWSELALDAGFYDQSHLVNEFQALCGLTPGMFAQRAVSLSSKTAA